jgi:hypothetical protein
VKLPAKVDNIVVDFEAEGFENTTKKSVTE